VGCWAGSPFPTSWGSGEYSKLPQRGPGKRFLAFHRRRTASLELVEGQVLAVHGRLVLPPEIGVWFDRSTVADARSSAIDPMTFDLVNVNQGSRYNSNSGVVTIASAGYYYLFISAAAAPRQVGRPTRLRYEMLV